ncbi:hypothetical protein N8T08_009664 [Aspergillus melleus]|uniref:Uncharacterized protein n=1 Tax=Aspergillus melleus TaxID=138277 RepID=A0ACC3AT50_9EURO|nr:hypothetical protein N8T08_009664 [Aspergillus melleus]
MSLPQIKNQWHSVTTPLDHATYIKNETCIRLMASIFLMDCHLVMLFNNPPHLTLMEMQFDLPAEEHGFHIPDQAAWELWATSDREYTQPPPLNRFVQELLQNDWPGVGQDQYQKLNVFDMFIIISGQPHAPSVVQDGLSW